MTVDLRPIATDKAMAGDRLLIYSGPRWVRPDGATWTPIDQVVRHAALPNGGYAVTCMGKSVRLLPDEATAAALDVATMDNIAGPRRFGPVLNAADAPDWLAWRVETDEGITVAPNGDVVLAELDGVKLGLFLTDWRRSFGDACAVDGGSVSLALGTIKDRLDRINLDPTTVSANNRTGSIIMEYDTQTWADFYANYLTDPPGYGSIYSGALEASAGQGSNPTFARLFRAFLQFDTSGIVRPIKLAVLRLTPKTIRQADTIHFHTLSDYGTLGKEDYNAALGTDLGTKTTASMTVGTSFDITLAPANINTSGKTCFTARSSYDRSDTGWDGGWYPFPYGAEFEDDDDTHPPVLELTLRMQYQQRAMLGVG